ncbi:hypothetical protein DPMN_075743 [Dreissena polymorpha]|uniref:Uncharacterized protein n=1 Tax=Dreissena polymorpha TaxID=45954 RepID=A0A9D3YL28_DREPO|nr:hypothetical protein DPMN_075743 [Dreissena polymorpha]
MLSPSKIVRKDGLKTKLILLEVYIISISTVYWFGKAWSGFLVCSFTPEIIAWRKRLQKRAIHNGGLVRYHTNTPHRSDGHTGGNLWNPHTNEITRKNQMGKNQPTFYAGASQERSSKKQIVYKPK